MNTALIAGRGLLPVEIARRLDEPLILSLGGDEELSRYAGKLVELSTPSLGRAIKLMKSYSCDSVIMAGLIPKRLMYSVGVLFDRTNRKVLKKTLKDDHSLLGSIVSELEANGIKVLPYWEILPDFLASTGKLSTRQPTEREINDVNYGREILRVTLPCSFGQSVCVADGSVSAIESMEGTDATIARAGEICGRGVVVKMMKPSQDMRYDLPTVGTSTLETMKRAGLTCLAVEAGKTLILEPEKFFALSEKYKIAVWGIAS